MEVSAIDYDPTLLKNTSLPYILDKNYWYTFEVKLTFDNCNELHEIPLVLFPKCILARHAEKNT